MSAELCFEALSDEPVISQLIENFGYNQFFARKLVEQFGREALRVAEACEKPLRKAIRVNTLKTTHEKLVRRLEEKGFALEKITWLKNGYWVLSEPNSPTLGATHEYLFGHYLLQSPPSMYTVEVLDPQPGETILDLAAGAGGKATYISQLMENRGTLVAVEPKRQKVAALRSNISRMGCLNTIILQMDGRDIVSLDIAFDRVLLDAPCTSSGLVPKYPWLKSRISMEDVSELTQLQRELLEAAYSVLKKGGVLVYSTCSCFREEGEDVVEWLLKKGAEPSPLRQPIGGESGLFVRFYTHLHGTEGFFVCRLTKR